MWRQGIARVEWRFMRIRIGIAAVQEETRKLAVGLMLAGVVATVIQDVPTGLGVVVIALGFGLMVLGVLRKAD